MLEEKARQAILTVRAEAADRGTVATFLLHREHSHLMRLGNSSVSLNTSETLTRLDVEVTEGWRQGSQTRLGEIASASDVRAAFEVALGKARLAMEKDYQPLRDVVEEAVAEEVQHDEALAVLDPAVKAEAYRRVIAEVGEGYDYSGSWSSGVTEQYLVTTANDREAWHRGTDQRFNVVLKHPRHRWELSDTQTGWRAADVAVERTVERLRNLLPVYEGAAAARTEPGRHTVLFGAEALADIAGMAVWTGLWGRAWEEKVGWTAKEHPGDRILGENINLSDDPTHDDTYRFGFDLSGQRRRPFPLVMAGRMVALMYDSVTAAKYGRTPTGHNLGNTSFALATGDGPAGPLEAVRGLRRVLYIPALHYTHIPNPSEGLFTGSSRFNAVLVEDGRIAGPIFSTRITDTFRNVLGNVLLLSPTAVSVNQSDTYGRRSPVAMSVPAYAVVEGVHITDSAEAF